MSYLPEDSQVQQESAPGAPHLQDLESMLAGKSRQKDITHISKLPTEMLAAVFVEVLMSSQPPNSHSILPITQVCRHWRYITINDPMLWTQVNMSRIYPGMVAWSKQAPLAVRFEEDEEWELPSFAKDFIPANMHRIQDLVVDVLPNIVEPIVALFCHPAPLLQGITIRYYGTEQDLVLHAVSQLLGRNTPTLQRLSVGGMTVDWEWPIFSNLVELELDGIEPQPPVLLLLRRMPHIQVFESTMPITDCPEDCNAIIPDSEMVHLASLHRLVLWNSSFRTLSSLFRHLRIPSTAHMNLFVLPGDDDFTVDYPPLFEPCQQVRVEVEEGAVHFTTSSVAAQVSVSHRLTDCFMASLHAFAVPCGIKSLALNMNGHALKLGWPAMFHLVRHVEHLDLQYDQPGRSLIQALTNREGSSESLSLPRLGRLTLRVIGLPKVVADAFDVLSKLLQERCEQGARISAVDVLVDWHGVKGMTPEGLDGLKDVVDVIFWENRVIKSPGVVEMRCRAEV